jgi:hypothetical protein
MSIKRLGLMFAVVAATCAGAETGYAQSNRTWVSGTGDDTNPCSRTSPCKTFAGAIGQTAPSGEINCLDPGGFGTVTISMPVTINCEGVSEAGIQVGSGGHGITIATTGVVNLFGLDINGAAGTPSLGVYVSSAATVNIRSCKIYNFSGAGGIGIFFAPGDTSVTGGTLVVDNVFVSGSGVGIQHWSTSGASNMTVRNSDINNNQSGIIVQVIGGTHAGTTIEQTTLAFNSQYGLLVSSSGAVAVIGSSTVVNNATGVSAQSGGAIFSFKNNNIGGNTTDGTPLTAYPGYTGGGG